MATPMHNRDLQSLYDATEEDLRYGIGLLAVEGRGPVPLIGVHYRNWPREKLELIRESFREGIELAAKTNAGAALDLHLATRQKIVVRSQQDGHTNVIRAPAWDALLTGVDPQVLQRFEDGRRMCGGFLLLVQAEEWEFTTIVHDDELPPVVGPLAPRSDLTAGGT